MLTTLVYFVAQTTPESGGSSSLITLYYIAGVVVAMLGLMEGGRRFFIRQRQKWTEEGETRAKQSAAIEENTKKMQQNTDAIGKLTLQLTNFVASVTTQMNGLGNRISRLEDFRRRNDGD
jgi:uncharacterized protein HemX